MADVFAPQPVKTKTAGDVSVKIDQSTPGTTNLVALAADQTVNVTKVAGTTADTNSGSKSAGTLRVVLATDQPALTNKLLVTPDSVALPANQSVNQAQVAGTATATGSGAANSGTQRVILATDNPTVTVSAGLSFTTGDSGHLTSAALAAGATVTLDGPQIASGTAKLFEATVGSSVALKAQLGTWDGATFTVFRTFFVLANSTLVYIPARYDEITKATGATAKFRWSITNNDNANAADVYASITHAI